ncbi:MAG: MarR family winged helix-turn-helix transcriptional regulator [Gemmataceae bacterium]
MLEYDFEESIGFWIVMTSRQWEKALNDELAPHNITYRQVQVLGWLALDGELTQSQIAERMRIEAPTLTNILDRMERDRWIARVTSAQDRRKKIVKPTPRVQPVWAKIVKAARRVRGRATAGLNPKDIALVKKILGQIQDNLKAPRGLEEAI